jgi:hypothetical protein
MIASFIGLFVASLVVATAILHAEVGDLSRARHHLSDGQPYSRACPITTLPGSRSCSAKARSMRPLASCRASRRCTTALASRRALPA